MRWNEWHRQCTVYKFGISNLILYCTEFLVPIIVFAPSEENEIRFFKINGSDSKLSNMILYRFSAVQFPLVSNNSYN